jgi:hypothetical protein
MTLPPAPLLEQLVWFIVEGAKSLKLIAMEEARWTRGFTWFGPPECNTLRQQEMCVLLCA